MSNDILIATFNLLPVLVEYMLHNICYVNNNTLILQTIVLWDNPEYRSWSLRSHVLIDSCCQVWLLQHGFSYRAYWRPVKFCSFCYSFSEFLFTNLLMVFISVLCLLRKPSSPCICTDSFRSVNQINFFSSSSQNWKLIRDACSIPVGGTIFLPQDFSV